MKTIICLPADRDGNKLWLKDLRIIEGRYFLKYKSTYNDIPFIETEIYLTDGYMNFIITSDDGTILWRFNKKWIEKLKDNE